ncbi:ATP-binding cassette domain-containing protein [Paenibacillus psychroresistens]|uniref:ATP-binding cassette domain-containing protein n=1 Tax=Paenibacillus psychroresistens TaxID=1778678 RepID=A0A6B8RBS9_9BACL|nr:oligopeptide/dipeptide ABC transporter ATP-binding protein [Paenibacillus psychroresistens]QGQ94011.1 ATP-binding cassette domain-containing protein [Paenibacillus psychroresistens]
MVERDDLLLEVKNLSKVYPLVGAFRKQVGTIKALNDFSITVKQGETLGLVGETGCGKSTAGRVILRLIDATSGAVIFQKQDITAVKGSQLRSIRKDMQMIFQDPNASLNPRMMVGDIISEPIRNYSGQSKIQTKDQTMELLQRVGLSGEAYFQYPLEFSGGQRQRIGIARALALKPKLILADEPVSALDISVQAQVLNLMQDLQQEYNMSYLFIAHDLSVVKHISDRIGVMYLGGLVEVADKISLYQSPLHPYTRDLIAAIPVPDPRKRVERMAFEGEITRPNDSFTGCAFQSRCRFAKPECSEIKPTLKQVGPGHQVACHLY